MIVASFTQNGCVSKTRLVLLCRVSVVAFQRGIAVTDMLSGLLTREFLPKDGDLT